MNKALFLFLFLLHIERPALAELQGAWKLSAMEYKGQNLPLPNPDLFLTWTFYANGTERLYWDRGGEEFCERFAHFSVADGYLKEVTFALNPKNSIECSRDPDMQMGKETLTQIQILEKQLRLLIPMGEDELVYILTPHSFIQ